MTAKDVVNMLDAVSVRLLKGMDLDNAELRREVVAAVQDCTQFKKALTDECLAGATLRPGRMG